MIGVFFAKRIITPSSGLTVTFNAKSSPCFVIISILAGFRPAKVPCINARSFSLRLNDFMWFSYNGGGKSGSKISKYLMDYYKVLPYNSEESDTTQK